ncbi:MAG: Hsp20/alpha crystallin family protein [Candidatus Odinarchaeota archaeon]
MSSDPVDFENFARNLFEYIKHLNEHHDATTDTQYPLGNTLDLYKTLEKDSADMVSEPEFERIVDGDMVILIFTLPGASKDDIKFKRKAGFLIVEARTRDRYYRKQVRLESYIDESSIKGRVKNGFLELRARRIY